MSKASLDGALRMQILAHIQQVLSNDYDTDVKPVSASELMMPVLDADGNEKFALIKISIPRGSRSDGTFIPYDGYAAADAYAEDVALDEEKKKARQEERDRKQKEKERKAAARKVVKKLNSEGLDAMIHEKEDE